MSALGGALAVGLALIAEEVLVTSRGGSAAVAGAFGVVAHGVERIADPNLPAIPNLADRKAQPSGPPARTPATALNPATGLPWAAGGK